MINSVGAEQHHLTHYVDLRKVFPAQMGTIMLRSDFTEVKRPRNGIIFLK